jgi:hypothetical protein
LPFRPGPALLLAILGAGPALATPHSVEELLRPARVRDIALSPDGAKVALALRSGHEAHGDVLTIVEVGTADRQAEPLKFSLGARDRVSINWIDWAGPTRLLVGVTVDDGTDDSIPSRRIMAMDADGSNPRMLFENKTALLRRAISLDRVVGRVPGAPSQVLMPAWTGHNYNLFRVDVNSGAAIQIARGHTGTFAWRVDDGLPALRYDKSETGTTVRVYGHSGAGDDDWSLIAKYGRVHSDVLDWDYAGDAPGVGQIYVRTRKDDSDTAGIYPFDIRTNVLGPAVSDVRDYDLHRVFYVDDRFGGVTYFGDTLGAFQQASSYFAYENNDWLLVALDTACLNFDVDAIQAKWLERLIQKAVGKRVALFSHHQLYSQLDSQGPKLAHSLGSLLQDKAIHIWYWGHEHRCVLYDLHAGHNLVARCIGHGGMPQRRGKEKDAPIDSRKSDAIWRRLPAKPNIAPSALILDGRNSFIKHEEDTYAPHGYLTLQFSGKKLHETYFLPDGTVAKEVDL